MALLIKVSPFNDDLLSAWSKKSALVLSKQLSQTDKVRVQTEGSYIKASNFW